MSYASRLFCHRKIYDLENTNELFLHAILENVRHHINNCHDYAKIAARCGFAIEEVKTIDDIYKIPPIPTVFLKNHTLYSVSPKHLMLKSTTSGTSGKVSEMALDWPSSLRGIGMIMGMFFTNKLISPRLTNYVVLGYQPAKRNKIGAVKTAYATTYAA